MPSAGVQRTAPATRRASTFETRVLHVVRRIPAGRVATYGDVAAMAGRPRAWRAVGTIMRTCRSPSVPCHRVVGSGGRLGGYSDPILKRRLLQDEGVIVGPGTIRGFAAVRWMPRDECSDKPSD
ncbi:MAG: MGMT family protein [Acidobacteria bacterium]|nr:MGMT family protein [Acidobacteriota bacterium]